ncbi:sialate O-acetylesterase [Pseudopedobacter beijingensis]|uniref:Sialate O-acetylesterase n=1 Tax=Pseudopedobacter beijingensis TaxID=1207056 RepID=A0ABW4IBE5_9SPHI
MRYRILFFLLISAFFVKADIKLPALVGDNMVLQQNATINIWGKAKANSKVTVKVGWDNNVYSTSSDAVGNWEIKVKTIGGSQTAYEMMISDGNEINLKNILLGEVWLCGGQSNMEMSTRGYTNQPIDNALDEMMDFDYPSIRFFLVQKNFSIEVQSDIIGKWNLLNPKVIETASVVGLNFAKIINKILNVPVGVIGCYWGGSTIEAWMSEESLREFGPVIINKESLDRKNPNIHRVANMTPTVLYNAMLKPISRYAISGALFYQGEANVNNPDRYQKLLPAMVKNWRKDFEINFPFYYVQIAPFRYGGSNEIEAALLREAQYKAKTDIPNSGIVSTIDIGSESTIHPSDKRTVAKRLAYLALYKTYKINGLNGETPYYVSHTIEGDKAIITLENIGYGLHSKTERFMGFEIAGEDKVFYPATVKNVNRVNNKLIVFSDRVKKPVAVRYAFKNYQYGNLYNSYGIAALPFRTDSW